MKRVLIYHAIGTLTPDHFRWSIESLNRQNIHWEDFVLYNHSGRKDNKILHWLNRDMFDNVSIFDRRNKVKGSVADWNEQFKRIGNSDIYFVHKADFYLADGVLQRFEEICEHDKPMFVGVKKFDMEETTDIPLIREMAALKSFDKAIGAVGSHPYDPSGEPKWDGVMHGYNDLARPLLLPDKNETNMKYGACGFICKSEVEKIVDDRIYAIHMFHELPFEERLEDKQIMGMRY